ncbi:unnamed protein product, partial [Mycena citricolor]
QRLVAVDNERRDDAREETSLISQIRKGTEIENGQTRTKINRPSISLCQPSMRP